MAANSNEFPARGQNNSHVRVLIGRAAYEAIGGMRDELFIDGIDHEWCFRAKSLGYRTFVARDVTMSHDMGEVGVSLFGRYQACL